MVARADPRPGGGLRGRWEAPHVVPELGENLLGAAAADARDRIEPLNRWPKRARLLLDPLVEARDLLVEEFDVVQAQGAGEDPARRLDELMPARKPARTSVRPPDASSPSRSLQRKNTLLPFCACPFPPDALESRRPIRPVRDRHARAPPTTIKAPTRLNVVG